MADIGTAYVQIEPTAKGIAGKLSGEFSAAGEASGKSFSGGFGKIVAGAGAVVTGAVAAGTAAVGKFAISAVETGKEFDAAMSQVAATMGMTSDDIEKNVDGAGDKFQALRDKAQQMGAETNFSMTQAAEGLNILAMSGFDSTQSIDMLEDVLHLAAAGGIDMANSAGYISGAMKGFNDETKTSADYADLMAKGATLANTSVEQLGEAISSGAASAATYGQSADSMTISLLRLAEQNEVGSAASTALAAAMKNLYTPSDQAKEALRELGVEAYKDGKALDFNDVVNNLSAALADYSEEEANAYKQTIFGIQGLDAFNKMAVTSTEKQEEWAAALAGSGGEAAKQYETMTDNLVGDIDIWNSALDGFKGAISDQITPTIREFVQFGSDGLGKLTEAFKEGGLSGAVDMLGSILSEGIAKITSMLPGMVEAGMQLISALGQGLMANLPQLTSAAVDIIMMLAQYIIEALPSLIEAAAQIILQLATGIAEALPTLIPTIVEVLLTIVQYLIENIDLIIQAGISLFMGLVNGLIEALPILIEKLPELVQQICDALIQNLPLIIQAIFQINMAVWQALIENAPMLISALIEIAGMLIATLVELAPQILAELANGLMQVLAMFAEYGAKFVSWVVENGAQIIQAFVAWLSKLPERLGYYAGLAIGTFIKFMNELPGKISTLLTTVLNKVIAFGKNFMEQGPKIAKQFATGLINNIKELPKKLVEVGKNIVAGIWQGIQDAWSSFSEGVSSLFGGLIDGLKEGLGINSPSKVFAKEVGQWIPAGIAQGIENGMSVLNGAMSDLTMSISPAGMDDMGTVYAQRSGMTTSLGKTYTFNNTFNIDGAQDPEALAQYLVGTLKRQARMA